MADRDGPVVELDGVRVIADRPPPVQRERIPGSFEAPDIPLRFARQGPPPRRRAA
jgi:hypothetical protein